MKHRPEDLFRAEKERARSSTTSQHARLLAEAKAAFDKLMAEGQAARKSGRPRKHPLPPLKTTSSRTPPPPRPPTPTPPPVVAKPVTPAAAPAVTKTATPAVKPVKAAAKPAPAAKKKAAPPPPAASAKSKAKSAKKR